MKHLSGKPSIPAIRFDRPHSRELEPILHFDCGTDKHTLARLQRFREWCRLNPVKNKPPGHC